MVSGKLMTWIVNYLGRSNTEMSTMVKKFSQVGIFEFSVNPDGSITNTMTQAEINNALAYPQVKWFLTVQALGSTLQGLWQNTNGCQDNLIANLQNLLNQYPWCAGIDIDFEQGGGSQFTDQAVALFQRIYNLCHANGKLMHCDLPGLTGPGQSLGGEYWCDYNKLEPYFDTCTIMTYGYNWSGSAPGAITPAQWGKAVYDYAITCIPPEKIFLGTGMYAIRWEVYTDPSNLGQTYRGTSESYYALLAWLLGAYTHGGNQPHIPWAAFWDDTQKTPYVYLHMYDWMRIDDITRVDAPATTITYNGIQQLTCYSKAQSPTFNGQVGNEISSPASYGGAINVGSGFVSARQPKTGEKPGYAVYNFSVPSAGNYEIVFRVNFPWWDAAQVGCYLDATVDGQGNVSGGTPLTVSQPNQWYPLARQVHYISAGTHYLSAGSHTLVFSGNLSQYSSHGAAQFWGFRVCSSFSFTMDGGQGWFYMRPQQMKDVNGNMVLPSTGYILTGEVLRHPPEYATVWSDNWGQYAPGGNPTSSLGTWYNVSGSWSVSGTYPYASTLNGSGTLTIGYSGFGDLCVWADFSFTGNEAGLIVGSNRIGLTSDGRVVFNGTTVGHANTSGSHELRARCRSGTYDIYVDGAHIATTSGSGSTTFGLYTNGATMSCTQLNAGDAYVYMPREALTIVTPAGSQLLGRIPRTGVTWLDPWGYFQVPNGVEEYNTRTGSNIDISADFDYIHTGPIPVSTSSPIQVQVQQTDAGVWTQKLYLCDQDGASIAYYSDMNVFQYWWEQATIQYGLAGVAFWQLGLEDPRIFNQVPDQW